MTMLAQDDTQSGRSVRQMALVVSTSVWRWTETAGLRVADGDVLLALADTPGVRAAGVSAQAGLPLDVVYAALHRLTDRGYVLEEHRQHRLTAEGRRLVAGFELAQTEGTP